MSLSVFASAICGKYTQEVGCKFLTEDESTLFYESSLSQLKLYGVKKKIIFELEPSIHSANNKKICVYLLQHVLN